MAVHEFTAADGSPVRTETGVGTITSVEHTEGRRNAQVRIAAAHLRQPVTGWVDTQGAQWPRVTWARDTGASIWYRVDTHRHRKATGPVDTPLGDLDNMSKTRDLVRLEVPERAPADTTIALDPFADLKPATPAADGGGADGSVRPPAATATDGQRPQGTPSPPATTPPTPPAGNPSPRPQTAPPTPGPPLTSAALDALHDVVQAVQANADDAWVGSCCDDALAAGCTRGQVLHVLDRARRGLDVGLPARPTATDAATDAAAPAAGPAAGPAPDAPRDAARGALDRQRDPDGLTRPVTPADVTEPHTAPGDPGRNLVGATNGMSRRVSPRGNVTADGKMWDLTNMDGSVNFGSAAAIAVGELVTLASAQRMTRLRSLNHQDPERYALRPPTPYEVDSLARTLLAIADRIQAHLRGGGRPDRLGGSHRQARYALKEAIAVYPIPWGDNAAMGRWVREVEAYGCTLSDVLAGIVLKHDPVPRDDGDTTTGASRGEVPPGGPDHR